MPLRPGVAESSVARVANHIRSLTDDQIIDLLHQLPAEVHHALTSAAYPEVFTAERDARPEPVPGLPAAPSAPPAEVTGGTPEATQEWTETEPEPWPADEPVPYDRQCEAMAEHLCNEHGAAPEQVPADDLDAMEADHDADHRRRGDRPTPAHQPGHKHVGRRAIELARQRAAKVAFAVKAGRFGREVARHERRGAAR